MLNIDAGEKLLDEALRAIDTRNYSLALSKLNDAGSHGLKRTPQFESAYAVCHAALKQQFNQSISMCKWAIELEPCESAHYLQLGRIYLLANDRKASLHVFREGMLYNRDRRILSEMKNLGVRRRPVFSSLPRGHFLNRITGKFVRRFTKA